VAHATLACNQSVEPAPGVSPQRAVVVAEIGAVRPVEGRLTGGFAHAPFPAGLAPDALLDDALAEALRPLGRGASGTDGRRPDTRVLADSGVRELLDGKWDEAVTQLERARELAPRDAWIASDLAVAYGARGREHARPYDLFLALKAAEEAIALAPDLLEARFNQALALTRMHMPWAAEPAWQEYLSLDSDSPWAGEARHHRSEAHAALGEEERWRQQRRQLRRAALRGDGHTVERLVDRFRLRARRWAAEDLLGQWSEERQVGRTAEAAAVLRVARAVAAALTRLGGDHLLLESVERVEELEAGGDEESIAHLAAGHIAFRDGVRDFDARGAEAAPTLGRAEAALARAGSPLALWATLYLAAGDNQIRSYGALEERLETIERAAQGRPYPTLLARVLWIRGIDALVRGSEFEAGLRSFLDALALAQSTGELEHAAVLQQLIAEYYVWVGNRERVWSHLHLALRTLPRIPEARRRQLILWSAGAAARDSGARGVARRFDAEALRIARTTQQPVPMSSALVSLARSRWQAGKLAEARAYLAAAENWAQRITLPEARVSALSTIWLSTGELLAEADPHAAAGAIDRLIELAHEAEDDAALPRAHYARARVRRALGDDAGAERDLHAALTAIERQRGEVAAENRASFLDTLRAVYADLARLQLERDRPDRAYAYVEQAQARVLYELAAGARGGRELALFHIDEVQAALPPDTLLLQLTAWDEVLLGWAISSERWEFGRSAVAKDDLERRIDALRQALLTGDPAALGRELFALLMKPAQGMLRPGMDVVLVLGDGLHGLPVAALVDPASGRYLVEDYDLSVSPSARVALHSSSRCARPPRQGGPALLRVEAPTLSELHFPDLPPLGRAAGIDGDVVALFDRAHALSGAEATVAAVLGAAGRYELLHFGTHALASTNDPLRARILLAPDPRSGDSGALMPRHIAAASLPETCVAVLAACRTARGPSSPTEGALSLSYPFLAAGVPAVVGTLWDVSDRAAAAFGTEFYRRIGEGLDVTSAANGAQRALLASGRPELRRPSAWAAFQLVGRGSFALARGDTR
jgi:tetratricopeptide (TPR) repeat protein